MSVIVFVFTLYRFTMNQPWCAKTGPLLTFLLGPGCFKTSYGNEDQKEKRAGFSLTKLESGKLNEDATRTFPTKPLQSQWINRLELDPEVY